MLLRNKSIEICHLSHQLQVSSRAPRSMDLLFYFVNIRPYVKMLLLLQIAFQLFQTFPDVSSQRSSQKHFLLDLLNFATSNFNDLIVFINMGPYRSEISKCYFFKSPLSCCKHFLHFLLGSPHKILVCVFEILDLMIFKLFFQITEIIIISYRETKT